MKMRSKIVTCLVLALSISCLATGCKKKAQETETSSETIRVTEKQTESETAKKATNTSTTFKSKDGSISIKLPDDTWTMKKEGTKNGPLSHRTRERSRSYIIPEMRRTDLFFRPLKKKY